MRHAFVRLQTDRYAEYPKLKELVERKDGLIASRATPPAFLQVCHVFHRRSLYVVMSPKAAAALRCEDSVSCLHWCALTQKLCCNARGQHSFTLYSACSLACQTTVFRQGG